MSEQININPESEIELIDEVKLAAKVILFNDDWHTFDEVIYQIIKATGYNYEKAEAITYEVHNKGKAIVYSGELAKCIQVSSVLEEIQLRTEIQL
ncbi:MAG TPA: ATP-dependent Clp protease adaptor ClpS [Candidatus Kapabacteria bacterium]|jgi:ATP-dependent Clp protease adapter protein ClpS|nr:ATP-dependent Clp protease adaptor ClpS [Candidatus Kapabacteria bacterium]HPP38784.1 ATP-dependent Clp protease adaptor ClpS [Candidatus Kapabacteria bacterium]HPU23421.1 ATP-dependent Clp protease adaptor ClpS [Candidatus Kapabacteria bacterium]